MKTKCAYVLMMGLCLTGAANATIDPTWAGADASVYAQWDEWMGVNIGGLTAPPDYFEVVSAEGSVLSDVAGQDQPDAMITDSIYGTDGGDSWLELASNYDLSFWMPSFSGYGTQEGWIQLSYWDDELDPTWRAGFDLGITLSGGNGVMTSGLVFEGEEVVDGLITEAYSFAVTGSADGFFVDLAADASSFESGLYLESASIDTLSYDAIPEPATGVLFLFGAALVRQARKKKSEIA